MSSLPYSTRPYFLPSPAPYADRSLLTQAASEVWFAVPLGIHNWHNMTTDHRPVGLLSSKTLGTVRRTMGLMAVLTRTLRCLRHQKHHFALLVL